MAYTPKYMIYTTEYRILVPFDWMAILVAARPSSHALLPLTDFLTWAGWAL
jgi:hypothetical protein